MSGNFFDKYPYTDFHELNLDWILNKVKETDKKVDDFTVFNTLTWAGEWDASKSYVKWSIVQDQDGNGYLSVQPVPKNVPLTDENYWQQVAKYQALYAAFDQRITHAQNSADSADRNAAQAVSDAETASDLAKTLSDDRLQNQICICIGDSYGVNQLPDGSATTGWPVYLNQYAGFKKFYNYCNNGSGFCSSGASTPSFTTMLQTQAGKMSQAERDAVTLIVVAGGANDYGHPFDDFVSAIHGLVNYANSTFKRAQVYIGSIGSGVPGKITASTSSTHWVNAATYTNIKNTKVFINGAASTSGAHVMGDIWKWATINNLWTDFLHPTTYGRSVIARQILHSLNGEPADMIQESPFVQDGLSGTIRFVDGLYLALSNASLSGTVGSSSDFWYINCYSARAQFYEYGYTMANCLYYNGTEFRVIPTRVTLHPDEHRFLFNGYNLNSSHTNWEHFNFTSVQGVDFQLNPNEASPT